MIGNQEPPVCPPPAVLVVVGASGVGKTTLVSHLAALALPEVGCYHFDTIGLPAEAEITIRFGGGEAFQAWALGQWIARFVRNEDRVRVAVLDAQVRPSTVRETLAQHGIARGGAVLVDCATTDRHARLRGPRGQPELVNAQMDAWAACLRGQADALGIPIVDTTGASLETTVMMLREYVSALLEPERGLHDATRS
jgi:energy-coupling factor transporter ATP-binding protein EcfA2